MRFNRFLSFVTSLSLFPFLLFDSFSLSASASDAIEPGSPESFIKWVSATLSYVDDTLQNLLEPGPPDVITWSLDSVQYAWEMRSLLIAYSTWYDNQNVDGSAVSFETYSGYTGVRYNSTDFIALPCIFTLCNTSEYSYSFSNVSSFAVLPYSYLSTTSTSRLPYVMYRYDRYLVFQFPEYNTNFCDASDRTVNFSVTYYLEAMRNPSQGASWRYTPYLACSAFSGATFVNAPGSNSISPPHSVSSSDDLLTQFNDIRDRYSDTDSFDDFPDITVPVNDVDFEKEDETHPSGCNCNIH